MTVLLTGATGYVGGRLLGVLERGGRRVRCLARRPGDLAARAAPSTEVVRGDVLDRASLDAALRGVDAAYYLVHAMGSAGGDFEAEEQAGARNFAEAAQAAGVGRIVYLGGLAAGGADLSAHLRSRRRVGDVLRRAGVPVVEFRASIVIGSGSLSFELVRALTERLPVMITPRWVAARAQPIAVDDLLRYLRAALDLPLDDHRIFDVGGADVVSYGGLMREYARQRGLRRLLISVPALTPRLSSLWLGLVTPVYARIGRKLIESLRHDSIVRDLSALTAFDFRPMGTRAAVAAALRNEDRAFAETRWSDARSSSGPERTWGGVRFGTRLVDSRTVRVAASPPAAFAPDPPDRRRGRLVLRQRPLAGPGPAGPARRRRRRPPGPARPRAPRRRRHRGLVAGGALRTGPPPAAGGRDEGPGPRLAGVRGDRRRRRVDHPPDRRVRPGGGGGTPLLVRPLAGPHPDVRRHAPGDRAAGGRAGAAGRVVVAALAGRCRRLLFECELKDHGGDDLRKRGLRVEALDSDGVALALELRRCDDGRHPAGSD